MHNAGTYPDPKAFIPERYLNSDGQLSSNAPEPNAAFGFGRRACPGMYMAQDTLWIITAMLLWAFKIEHKLDLGGNIIPVLGEYTFGVVR